jgi:hypothetical protein
LSGINICYYKYTEYLIALFKQRLEKYWSLFVPGVLSPWSMYCMWPIDMFYVAHVHVMKYCIILYDEEYLLDIRKQALLMLSVFGITFC